MTSQQSQNQTTQNDKYSNLEPKKNPSKDAPDSIRNPDPEKLPGANSEVNEPGNPSQFPDRHPDEIPVNEPNEVPQQDDQPPIVE